MIFFRCVVVLLLISGSLISQNNPSREILNDLCSDEMMGRGYVRFGHVKAAKYIQEYYKSIQLKQFKKGTYLQPFKIKANTFPNDLNVSIDGKPLNEGVDYILDPSSGTAKGKFGLIKVDQKNLMDFLDEVSLSKIKNFEGKVLVLNTLNSNNPDTLSIFNELKIGLSMICPIIWVNNEKFTWSISRDVAEFPILELKDSLIWDADSVYLDVENVFLRDIVTHNVIGSISGLKKKSIIISAHYDHLGMMGKALFPGANDNASGVAMLLSLANYFSDKSPKYNLVFIAFGAEEAGILGSKYYVENPLFPLDDIKFVLNLDIMGTGDEGITVVNGLLHKKQFKQLTSINKKQEYLSKIKIRGRAANSDHYWFSQLGIPSFFIYTLGGIKAYHDVYDRSETLPMSEFNDLFHLLIDFIEAI
ncbi:MAG: M20/M25/M40 family metallo-hydrolase [Bacteroidota bacterium]|nr:M20/M25/M40 family metallo-hydrolase [Bacteroidota bacterium]